MPNYFVFLLTSIVIVALVAASVGVLTGLAGMVSLCQMSFAGVGAWIVGYLGVAFPALPLPINVLIAAIVTMPLGVLVGLPALRLRGLNFAIVTLGFATICDVALSTIDFGGTAGSAVTRTGPLGNDRIYFFACLAVFVAVESLIVYAGRFRFASAWLAVKQSERATAAFGRNVALTKLSAIALSAGIAGLAGGLLAGQLGVLSARNFSPITSLVLFATAVTAGARYPVGALIAGVLAIAVPEVLTRLHLAPDLANVLFAVGTIAALLKGGGIADALVRRNRARGKLEPVLAPNAGNRNGASPLAPKLEPAFAANANANAIASVSANAHAIASVNAHPIILELDALCVRYGSVVALDGVSLKVARNSRIGIIGPNGAGKSSLIDAVSGFTPFSGRITFEGRAIEALTPARRARAGLRRSFQHDRTVGDLTIRAYLELCAARSLSEHEITDALRFARVGDAAAYVESLDVGARRLLEVAGILAARPSVALLDEPGAGLGYDDSLVLGERIAGIPERYGCAVVLIEHDMELIRRACDELLVLDFGKPIAFGRTADVLARPDVIAAYLGEEELAS